MSHIGQAPALGARATLRRAREVSPELTAGLGRTLLLALIAMVGRLVVPVTVQQTVDRGLGGPGGPRPGLILALVLGAAVGVLITGAAAAASNVRIYRASEAGLASLRVAAFRHVHQLSVLSQNGERRGALVARVTTDVDTVTNFVQYGGLMFLLSLGQLVVATALMLVYSWPLALLVWACYLPLFLTLPFLQRRVARAYTRVRELVADVLAAVSESVVGADTIRAYGIQARTGARVDGAVQAHARAAVRAQVLVAAAFSGGVLVSGLVVAAVVGVGAWLGAGGGLSIGRLLAFLFLVQLFTTPVQNGTEILNELQNALAGWRRVLAVLDTPADVPDPGPDGTPLPSGPIAVALEGVGYAYPGGPPVLSDVDLVLPVGSRVAVVGETGSGKTTLAKLVVRLMDPATGRVLLNGVDLREIPNDQLRGRVVMVAQEGFLIDDTVLANLRWGRPDLDRAAVAAAVAELGLADWVDGLVHGLDTDVGQRGESLSAGERQLVALVRAWLAEADLLVLDEATSSVDPATEVRLARTLDRLLAGRGSITIAHRLSTAEAADVVVVVDAGRVVDVGRYAELVGRCPAYQRLHAGWRAQQGGSGPVEGAAGLEPAGA